MPCRPVNAVDFTSDPMAALLYKNTGIANLRTHGYPEIYQTWDEGEQSTLVQGRGYVLANRIGHSLP